MPPVLSSPLMPTPAPPALGRAAGQSSLVLRSVLPVKRWSPRRGFRKRVVFRAAGSPAGGDGPPGRLSWSSISRSFRRGTERFLANFGESVKEEFGVDLEEAGLRAAGMVGGARRLAGSGETAVRRLWLERVPQFVDWNRWSRWKVTALAHFRISDCKFFVFLSYLTI